jgi:hypothetical protein
LSFFRPGIYVATCKCGGLAFSRKRRQQNSQNSLLLVKLNWKKMNSNVVISEVDALMCVVLSKVEKHVSYWELVGTTEYTEQSKILSAPDDYSTKNTQKYFKQFQSLNMIT